MTREGHLDALAVHVECAPGQERTAAVQERLARELAHQVKAYVGVSVAVAVLPTGSIERSAGKARRVVDKRHPDVQHLPRVAA